VSEVSQKAYRPRLDDVDRAKGLAILLVVIGHLARDSTPGQEWYWNLKLMIYEFHMPFFMFLSGMVMFYSGSADTSPADYRKKLGRRVHRLLVPFLLFGLLTLAAKVLAGSFASVDNKPSSLGSGLLALFWNTHSSPATSVWYIFVVFVYYLIVPPLLWLLRRSWMLLAPAAALYVLPLPEYFYLDRIGHYLVFFVLGGLASGHLADYEKLVDRWAVLWLGLFTCLLAAWPPPQHFSLEPTWRQSVIALLSLPALYALVRRPGLKHAELLGYLGGYSFAIYLFNTWMIGLAKGLMLRVMPWDDGHFLLYMAVLLAAGVVGPILLKACVLRRIKPLDAMTT
jgi:peptidoglycan/LPS O-acetylase OafA/YrhL